MSHLKAQHRQGIALPEDLSAFADFIENELDLEDGAWDRPLLIPNDSPDGDQRVAVDTPPRVQIIDDRTFLLFWIGTAILGLLMLVSCSA